MRKEYLIQITEQTAGASARAIVFTYGINGIISHIADCTPKHTEHAWDRWDKKLLSFFIGRSFDALVRALRERLSNTDWGKFNPKLAIIEVTRPKAEDLVLKSAGVGIIIDAGIKEWMTRSRYKTLYSLYREHKGDVISRTLSTDQQMRLYGVFIQDALYGEGYEPTALFDWFYYNDYELDEPTTIAGPNVFRWRNKLRNEKKAFTIYRKDGKRKVFIHPINTRVDEDGNVYKRSWGV